MASHARKPNGLSAKTILTAIASVLVVGILIIAIVLISNGGFTIFAGWLSSDEGDSSSAVSTNASEPASSEPVYTPIFSRPDQMRGVWLTPGVDFWKSADDTAETVKKQIDDAFAVLRDWRFNTLLVPLRSEDAALYPSHVFDSVTFTDKDGAAFDPLAYINQCAKDYGMYAYGVLDLHMRGENSWDPGGAITAATVQELVAEALAGSAFPGYLLDGYTYAGGDDTTAASLTAIIRETVAAIRQHNADAYVGLVADSVWAHKAQQPDGSDTGEVFAAYTDGHADTLGWLQRGLFDFVMLRADTSTEHGTAAFGTVLTWWSAVCAEQRLPLYITHAADKVGGKEAGWSSPDQLSLQILACKEAASWKGSAFYTLSALTADKTGSTQAVLKTLAGTIMTEYIADTLNISDPSKRTFETLESQTAFAGNADPNFPLTVNGKEIQLTEHGFFSWNTDLTPGVNTFKFEHKGETVTYKITYKVVVLKQITPTNDIQLEGGSTVVIRAIARKDSTVTAKIGGQSLKMTASPLQNNEDGYDESLSDYESFVCEYTLPKGVIGQEQALGAVRVEAVLGSLKESLTGGKITVEALPEPPPTTTTPPTAPPTAPPTSPGSSSGSASGADPTVPTAPGDLEPSDPSSGGETLVTGKVCVVKTDYAETFDGATSVEHSIPTFSHLPKGTIDVIVGTVQDGSIKFYKLGSGRRVYQSDVQLLQENGKLCANTIKKTAVQTGKNCTSLSLNMNWRVAFNVQLMNQTYPYAYRDNYTIYKQNADSLDITFYYTTAVPDAPDVSGNPLFSGAEWIAGQDNTRILRLTLRQKGEFYGYSVSWDNNGNLNFAFKHPHDVSSAPANKPLTGFKIVVDPGHGGDSDRPVFQRDENGNPIIWEPLQALQISQRLQKKLEALGATVIMTRKDNTTNPELEERIAPLRNSDVDLFISIHTNGANGKAHGPTVHFFNEYSFTVSRKIADRLEELYERFDNPTNRASGAPWSQFYVIRMATDCPTLLIECGFLDNAADRELLIRSDFQEAFCESTVEGILDYYRSTALYTTRTTSTGDAVSTTAATT